MRSFVPSFLRSCVLVALTAPGLNGQSLTPTNRTIEATRGTRASAFQIKSTILNQTRDVEIALPPSYATSSPARRYPVFVVVDGEWLLRSVAVAADELSRNSMIPEAIIVAIENTDDYQGRVHDLTPPGLSVSGSSRNEGGDRFIDFIEKELLPAIDKQFRGAAPRTFIGTSSGGILATYIAATRSTFRSVISLDAPIHLEDNWLAKKLTARASQGGDPVRYVSYEARFGWLDEQWNTLVAAAPSSWMLHREKMPLEGHETMQLVGAYLGLRQVFSDFSRMAAPQYPTTTILPYYAKIDAAFAAPLFPPKRVIRDVVENLLMEGRGADARVAYTRLVSGYGSPADSSDLLKQIADVEKRPAPTETVEGLLATPFATPAEASAYIGEWEGEVRHTEEAPPSKQILRIRVENGRVVGETVYPGAPPGYEVQRWEYLRITNDGISWGYMNGMRPRGVILYEAKRTGDTITGAMRFGGINFVRPDGRTGPLERATFRKVK